MFTLRLREQLTHVFGLITLCVVVVSCFTHSQVFAAPPSNFQTSLLVGDGLEGPSGFEIAPDGRIFILQRTGEVKIYKNGQLLQENFTVLPSVATGDRGLIGIAFDPNFISNKYVYFYYTGLDLLNYLVRFNASGDIGTEGPVILYQTTSPSDLLHVGGSVQFGPDGKLYFAVGDNGYPPNAQNLTNPHGKIMRINKDGSIPADNPFVGEPNVLPEIWAYGFRNPWRFQFDSQSGEMIGGDVGDYSIEEVNHIVKGGNYGWPLAEGPCQTQCPYNDPLYFYPHNDDSRAVTGGPIYRGSMFPEEYRGDYLFADYAGGFIKGMNIDIHDHNGITEIHNNGVYDFDATAGTVVDLKEAPDGSLYYITYYPGALYRVTYSVDNFIPVANATADKTKGVDPLTVNFSSAGSYDPDNDPLTYAWDFGDGTSSVLANPAKTYTQKGTYTVRLRVSDGANIALATPIIIQVGIPPTLTIGSPVDGSFYRSNDLITITSHAVDGVGNDISDANYTTEVVFHHDTHIHPFLGPIRGGRSHSFTVPSNGEPDPDVWYEIIVTASDTSGLSTTKAINIYPYKSNISVQTSPAGLNVKLDGISHTTPYTYESVEGYERELDVDRAQKIGNTWYVFDRWSDGGAAKHVVSTPTADTTYTAYFKPTTPFQAEYFNNKTLSGSPVLTREDPIIDFNWENSGPDPLLGLDNFSARWKKTENFVGGTYTFFTATDDGVRVYIDGQLKIDRWFDQGGELVQTDMYIPAGTREVMVEYYENAGGSTAFVDWKLAQADGFAAQYWNNAGAGSAPVVPITPPTLTRQDASIDFNWGSASPDPSINVDKFIAQWVRTQTFAEGAYRFTTTSDDGIRVYLNDLLILDQWNDHAPTTHFVDRVVPAGDHLIRVEYYENGGGAIASFNVSPVPGSQGTYAAEYFNNRDLAGIPVLTRNEASVNVDWGGGSPDPIVPVDNFSARWTRSLFFVDGTYRFTFTGDDGVRVFLDGQLILDGFVPQPPTTYTVDQPITEGTHTLVLEYNEWYGGAVAQFNFDRVGDLPSPTPEPGKFFAEYWNTSVGGGIPQIPTTPPTVTRNEDGINHSWGGSAPVAGINPDYFIARWTKTQTFENGYYRFTTTSDDGVRVYLDDQLILDQWNDHAPTTHFVDVQVAGGSHQVRVEFYERAGGAVAQFDVSALNSTPNLWQAEYFNNTTLSGIPVFSRAESQVNYNWSGGSPHASVSVDNFSARFTKTTYFSAGTKTFTVTGDDGVRVFIDGVIVLDKWIDQAPTTYYPTVNLTEGNHTIVIEYYERGGGATMVFVE